MWINNAVCWYSRTRFILFLKVSICNYLTKYRNSMISLYITESGQLFHYESMKWSQLKKDPKVRSLIIDIENHKVDYTKSIHSYDLRYEKEGKIWSLEYWKQIQSQWTILMISTQKHSISIQSMDPNDIQSHSNGDSQKSPIIKMDWIQWSRILHFACLPLNQNRSDKHSIVSMLLLWY